MGNYRRVYLTTDEWQDHLKGFNKVYFRQLMLPSLLYFISIVCFICLYIYPTSWLFFIGVIASMIARSDITFFSKTKYLLYKNKLDVNLNVEKQ